MPTVKRDKEKECIVKFGTAGWSEIQYWDLGKDRFNPERMKEYLTKFIPDRAKNNDPRNNRISFIQVYRLEDEWKEDWIGECRQTDQSNLFRDNKPLC